MLDLLRHAAFGGLRHHLQHVALDVHLPAVVEAAQAALLVAPEHERRATVRAILAEHADAPVAVAKDDEVLAEHPRAHGLAVGFAHFLDEADGLPMPAHELPHRRVAFDTAQQLVLFPSQHDDLLVGSIEITDARRGEELGDTARNAQPCGELLGEVRLARAHGFETNQHVVDAPSRNDDDTVGVADDDVA